MMTDNNSSFFILHKKNNCLNFVKICNVKRKHVTTEIFRQNLITTLISFLSEKLDQPHCAKRPVHSSN